jgi:hypothetical protein
MVKTNRNTKGRCKECRCKPCLCKEEIHCYQLTCSPKRRKRRKGRKRSKKVSQKGGFLPIAALGCGPCLAGPVIAATGLGTAGYMVSRSSSSNTKYVNGKTVHTRKETYKLKKTGKKRVKKVFSQKNNRIYLNKKELMPRPKTMKEANKRLNKKIKECVESGFKKC